MMADLPILCSDCFTFAINIPGAGKSRRAETEHLTLSKIKDGAGKGCQVCTRLVRTTLGSLLTSGLSRLDSLRIQGVDQKAKVILSGEDEPLLADVTVGAAVLIRGLRVYTLAGKSPQCPSIPW
jgi:hypothetical protein